jgi:hypothetical protein
MKIINKFSHAMDDFIESKMAAVILVLTLIAVLWRSFK